MKTTNNTNPSLRVLPKAAEVMAFSQEQINALPFFYDLDKIKEGGFAKRTWAKAPASLVYIARIDGPHVYWAFANKLNGIINLANGNASFVISGHYAWGDKYYTPRTTNPENLLQFFVVPTTPKQCAIAKGTDENDAVAYETRLGYQRHGFIDFDATTIDGVGLLTDTETGETIPVAFNVQIGRAHV